MTTAPVFVFEDLARRRDLTSRVAVARTAPRRPEAHDHLVVVSLRMWDPKQSPTGEVDFAEVRADLAALPTRFPNIEKILIDEEHHIDYLEAQLHIIKEVGLDNYLAQHIHGEDH